MYRILIVHDVEQQTRIGIKRWAYANRSLALASHQPYDFAVDRVSILDVNWEAIGKYDLVFNLDYSWAETFGSRLRERSCDTLYVVSFNRDSKSRQAKYLPTCHAADWVIVNNLDRWQADGVLDNTCCISNGVDTDAWYRTTEILFRRHRVLWTGSVGAGKGKGYHEILYPVQDELVRRGFDCDFRPVGEFGDAGTMHSGEMLAWYNGGSYILCTSESEGTPNYLLEGMACGCVPVTTNVGNVLEFGQLGEGQNVVLIDRSVDGVLAGLEYARLHRERLSNEAHDTMHSQWSYGPPGRRAGYFFALFRALLARGPANVKPFCYLDGTPEEVC